MVGKKKKRCTVNFIILFSLASLAGGEADGGVISEVQMVVSELNKSLPKPIDKSSTLLGIEQQELKLIYHVELVSELNEGVSLKQFHNETKSAIEDKMCKNKSAEYFVNNNINIVFRYVGIDGMPLSSIPINLNECF